MGDNSTSDQHPHQQQHPQQQNPEQNGVGGDAAGGNGAAEARWRNYQQLIWTQQQLQLQIQQQHQHHPQHPQQNHQPPQHPQQQLQTPKMNGMELENGTVVANGVGGNGAGGGGGGAGGQMNGQLHQTITPLSEKFPEGKAKGDGMDPWDAFDAQAAFLGPTLWDKRLPYDGQDFKLEYVDLEEFLTENGIPVEGQNGDNHYGKNTSNHHPHHNNNNNATPNNNTAVNGQLTNGHGAVNGMNGSSEPMENGDLSPADAAGLLGHYGTAGPSRNQQFHSLNHGSNQTGPNLLRGPSSLNQSENSRSPSPCGSSISRSSDSSSSLTNLNPHHHYHDLQQLGPEFDPRTRIFTEDELKPQPMIKKSKKQFVPDEQKDAKYWARRRKNNLAAKRSRDARRVKENQIAMRACFLEKENSILKQEIDRIQKENLLLKEQLNCCRREH